MVVGEGGKWVLGEKMKTEGVGEKNEKKGKGEKWLKNGLKTA